jgi:predicted metal-dependent peptidase
MTNLAQAASVRMTVKHPFWVELYYSMAVHEVGPDTDEAKQIQTAATDGRNLWINRDHWQGETLDGQMSLLVHELAHKMFLHPLRRGHREAELWNVACDYAINAMMVENKFWVGPDWLYEKKYAGWLAEAIYNDLIQQRKEGKPVPTMPAGRGDLRKPEGTPEEVAKVERDIQLAVDRAIANGKARGTLPAGIEQNVISTFAPVSEPWYNHLHRFMQAISSAEYDWARINRRTLRSHGMFTPLHESESMGEVHLYIDGSGSCFQRAQQVEFANHVNAIMSEAKPSKVVVRYFDSKVYPAQESEPGCFEITLHPKGGGSTDFRKLFDEVETPPEVAIVLTDMEGPMPDDDPGYPVIWADIGGHGSTHPFGDYIRVA